MPMKGFLERQDKISILINHQMDWFFRSLLPFININEQVDVISSLL